MQALLSMSLIASFCASCHLQSGARKKEPRLNSGSLLHGALSLVTAIAGSLQHRPCLQVSCIRRLSISKSAKFDKDGQLGEVLDGVLQSLFKRLHLNCPVTFLHILHMASVEEKHLAELVKSGHKVGNGFHNGSCRIGILHQKLQYRRIKDFLHTCIGGLLDGFHVLGILLSFVLQIFFGDLRRLFRDLGHTYVGGLPIEGPVINVPVSSILVKIEGSGEQLIGRTQTSHLKHGLGILRTDAVVLDQVHGSIFFHKPSRGL